MSFFKNIFGIGKSHPEKSESPSPITNDMGLGDVCHEYPFTELQLATNGFHDDNRVGGGLQGSVYRGFLENGAEIAIKAMLTDNSGSDDFAREVRLVSVKCRHPNLALLMGWSLDPKGNRYLVYEYVDGLSISQLIYSGNNLLLWSYRLNISIDVAQGIAHMHSCIPPLFHRDVKSSNVIMDSKYKSKLLDFGLTISADSSNTISVAKAEGTPGYACPVYVRTKIVTEKTDVFALGAFMFELLCSRPPAYLKSDKQTWDFFNSAEDVIKKDAASVSSRRDAACLWPEEIAREYAEILLDCVGGVPEERPTCMDVVRRLRDLRERCINGRRRSPQVMSHSSGLSGIRASPPYLMAGREFVKMVTQSNEAEEKKAEEKRLDAGTFDSGAVKEDLKQLIQQEVHVSDTDGSVSVSTTIPQSTPAFWTMPSGANPQIFNSVPYPMSFSGSKGIGVNGVSGSPNPSHFYSMDGNIIFAAPNAMGPSLLSPFSADMSGLTGHASPFNSAYRLLSSQQGIPVYGNDGGPSPFFSPLSPQGMYYYQFNNSLPRGGPWSPLSPSAPVSQQHFSSQQHSSTASNQHIAPIISPIGFHSGHPGDRTGFAATLFSSAPVPPSAVTHPVSSPSLPVQYSSSSPKDSNTMSVAASPLPLEGNEDQLLGKLGEMGDAGQVQHHLLREQHEGDKKDNNGSENAAESVICLNPQEAEKVSKRSQQEEPHPTIVVNPSLYGNTMHPVYNPPISTHQQLLAAANSNLQYCIASRDGIFFHPSLMVNSNCMESGVPVIDESNAVAQHVAEANLQQGMVQLNEVVGEAVHTTAKEGKEKDVDAESRGSGISSQGASAKNDSLRSFVKISSPIPMKVSQEESPPVDEQASYSSNLAEEGMQNGEETVRSGAYEEINSKGGFFPVTPSSTEQQDVSGFRRLPVEHVLVRSDKSIPSKKRSSQSKSVDSVKMSYSQSRIHNLVTQRKKRSSHERERSSGYDGSSPLSEFNRTEPTSVAQLTQIDPSPTHYNQRESSSAHQESSLSIGQAESVQIQKLGESLSRMSLDKEQKRDNSQLSSDDRKAKESINDVKPALAHTHLTSDKISSLVKEGMAPYLFELTTDGERAEAIPENMKSIRCYLISDVVQAMRVFSQNPSKKHVLPPIRLGRENWWFLYKLEPYLTTTSIDKEWFGGLSRKHAEINLVFMTRQEAVDEGVNGGPYVTVDGVEDVVLRVEIRLVSSINALMVSHIHLKSNESLTLGVKAKIYFPDVKKSRKRFLLLFSMCKNTQVHMKESVDDVEDIMVPTSTPTSH